MTNGKPDNPSKSGMFDKLPNATMRAIVLIAVIEGLLLLVMHELLVREWWPATSIPLRTCWYTLALAIPTTLCLLIKDVRDRRLWLMVLAYGLVLIPMAIYTGMQYVPAHATESGEIFVPYTLSQIAIWFVVMYFMSVRLEGGSLWRTTQDVCAFTWRHALALGLIAIYLLVLWALLHLWGALFKVIHIDFFETLFENRRFVYPIAGFAGGMAVVILRGQVDAVSMLERIAAALLRVLLPLLALITVVFLLALLFTGVQPLWKTGIATILMMILISLTLLFVNVVFFGDHYRYSVWMRWPIWGAMVLLPIYLGLCAWAMMLRVSQHGWSLERLWAAVVLLVFAAFVLSYAVAVIMRRDRWLEWMPAINKTMGAVVAILLALTALPILNLPRIAAASQVHRLMIERVTSENFDYAYLRFRLGEPGYQTIIALQQSPFAAEHAVVSVNIQKVLNAQNWWSLRAPSLAQAPTPPTNIVSAFKLYPINLKVPEALLQVIAKNSANADCFRLLGQCALFTIQLVNNEQPQFALAPACYCEDVQVYAVTNNIWLLVGYIHTSSYTKHKYLIDSLESGDYKLQKPKYPDIMINGLRYHVQPINDTNKN